MPSSQPQQLSQNSQTDITHSPPSVGCFSFHATNTTNRSSQQQQRTTTPKKRKKPSLFTVHVGTAHHHAGAMGYGKQACAIQ